ncbi:hypothetical protein [Kitasatospora sp. NPDC089509]|uniref:hypothetical protein n=1 Tax=Kitasatospora sp. NPDC089509 TaxID=3364079 RepID=UPI0037FDCB7F
MTSRRLRLLCLPLTVASVLVPVTGAVAAAGGSPPQLRAGGPPSDPESVTVLRPGADGAVTPLAGPHLRLVHLQADGRAQLTGGNGGNGPQDTGQVRAGDVIASPASGATPHGALVKVTGVHPGTDGTVTVDTRPADLVDALGDASADLTVPLTAADLSVRPAPGGKVNTAPGSGGSTGVRFDVDVPMPSGVTPTDGHSSALTAHLRFDPRLLFSYQRAHWYGAAPSKAEIGLTGDYDQSIELHAQGTAAYSSGHRPLHIPVAEVNVDKTVWLGPVPIVLTLKVDYFYDVSADGKITVDAEEHSQGQLRVGAHYDANGGWSALTSPDPTSRGSSSRITGSATAKAGVGSHVALGLYGSVGVTADTEPYLKATAKGEDAQADWALYGGLDITGSFFADLRVFGTKVLDKTWTLPPFHREWQLARGRV